MYCPGHAGVQGNEVADNLAGRALVDGEVKLDKPEVMQRLYTHLAQAEEIEWTTHYSIVRMKDLGVRKGDARKSRLAGRARRLQNQPATGTISMYTLRGILRRGTEHIWVCPECRDVASVNK